MAIVTFSKRLAIAALAATVSLTALTPASARDGQNRNALVAGALALGAIGIGMAIADKHREPAAIDDGEAYQAQYYGGEDDDYAYRPRRPRYYDGNDYSRDGNRYWQDYRRRDYPQQDNRQQQYQQQRQPQQQYQQRPAQPAPQQRPQAQPQPRPQAAPPRGQQQYMPSNIPTARSQGVQGGDH